MMYEGRPKLVTGEPRMTRNQDRNNNENIKVDIEVEGRMIHAEISPNIWEMLDEEGKRALVQTAILDQISRVMEDD